MNRKSLKDPITREVVPLGGNVGEDHHIFPTKFVPTLSGWQEKNMSSNIVLNIMRVTKPTNAEFLDTDPRAQMMKALGVNESHLSQDLMEQAISSDCLNILLKSEKSVDDFWEFIRLREIEVQNLISQDFHFAITPREAEESDS